MKEYSILYYRDREVTGRREGNGLYYGLQIDLLPENVYRLIRMCTMQQSGLVLLNYAIYRQKGRHACKIPDFTRGDWNKIEGLQFAK